MAESNIPDRVIFRNRGQQRQFLLEARDNLNTDWEDLAHVVGVHPRTVRQWVREKNRMSFVAANIITNKSGVQLPAGVRGKKWSDHLAAIGSSGGVARYKKYGRVALDEEYRQAQWLAWWNSKGKYLPSPLHNTPLPIKQAKKSERLAEFVGIVLGDGGISRLQLVITLHRFDDFAYSQFVRELIHDLFGVRPGIHRDRQFLADDIVVSRIKLVNYCIEKLGLKMGNKVRQQVDIPDWIKQKQEYLIACVRGLVDTDGCVFSHRYKVKGKQYIYKKLSFTSQSLPLKLSVYDCFEQLGLHPRLAQESDVRLESKASMQRYFEIVGSHNPKHLKRYAQ